MLKDMNVITDQKIGETMMTEKTLEKKRIFEKNHKTSPRKRTRYKSINDHKEETSEKRKIYTEN